MTNSNGIHTQTRRTYLKVSVIFVLLAFSLQALTWLYWNRILEPRLRREAASQATVLAHSQSVKLAEVLNIADPEKRLQILTESIGELLLFADPESRTPFFLGLDLEVDYDSVSAPNKSLDLAVGKRECLNCFHAEVALFSPDSDELLGIARFSVSDALFTRLTRDVKKTLFILSLLGLILLSGVWWGVMILMKEINRSRRQAEIANRAKSTFLANMSHELRTPLNSIIGFSELMHRDPDFPPRYKENLSIINRSGNYLLELINDVLDLSRIEAVQNTLTKTTFDFYDTLEKVVEMIRLRVEKKNLQFFFEQTDDLPRFINTDERKLRQILLNLLGNAVKFTEKGGVTLRVRQKQGKEVAKGTDDTKDKRSLMLHFEIEDTGPGIEPEEQKKMFDAFTQTRSGQNKKEGTGLGLTISRQFVETLGGEINVNSTVGKGALFSFTTHAEPGKASDLASCRPERRVIGLSAKDGKVSPHRILVVDDHKENRSLLQLLLEQVGFLVKTAENGRQAVELNNTWDPHLIWMDMRMPVMDGYEATKLICRGNVSKTIRKNNVLEEMSPTDENGDKENVTKERLKERPVIIALTASVFNEDRDAVLEAGCDDFVRRPFQESEIWEKIHKHLGVTFVYKNFTEVEKARIKIFDDDAINNAIRSLPVSVFMEFKNAVESIDFDKSMEIIGQIKEENESFASFLKGHVDTYQFDTLQQLFENDNSQIEDEKKVKNSLRNRS